MGRIPSSVRTCRWVSSRLPASFMIRSPRKKRMASAAAKNMACVAIARRSPARIDCSNGAYGKAMPIPPRTSPTLYPCRSWHVQAGGFGLERFHVAEDPVPRGTRQGVLESAPLLEPSEGCPLPVVRGVAGAQRLQAGDVDGVPLAGEDLPHEPGHVGRIDLCQFTAVGGPYVAVRDGQIRVWPDRFGDGDVHPAVRGDPLPGRDDRPEEDFPRRHGQPVPVYPDLREILLEG